MHPWSYEKCKWFLEVCFSEILMSFLFCNPDMAMAQKYMTPPTMGLPTPKQDYCHILFLMFVILSHGQIHVLAHIDMKRTPKHGKNTRGLVSLGGYVFW